jgi:hypothetical protein
MIAIIIIIIIVVVVVVVVVVITFRQGICSYISETNPVSVVYSIAAVLYLQRVLHVMLFHMSKCVLYFYTRTFRSMHVVPNMDVFL